MLLVQAGSQVPDKEPIHVFLLWLPREPSDLLVLDGELSGQLHANISLLEVEHASLAGVHMVQVN